MPPAVSRPQGDPPWGANGSRLEGNRLAEALHTPLEDLMQSPSGPIAWAALVVFALLLLLMYLSIGGA